MAKIEIDGKHIEAKDSQTIIEVADENNIHIPRFCYHKKLSVAANCRMCLVQVENANKALPACATPIKDGMKVWTKSKVATSAQKAVMEFLLINHPLDCPICDQGGECELQDLSMGYGHDKSSYSEVKRVVVDKNLGPLISTDMTRCIQCTRCVRFGAEIAGYPELGGMNRGENLEISTFVEKNIDSEVSGNMIDLCPVGALTSKPFRFKARTWELTQKSSLSVHDCIGTNIYLHLKNNQVLRVAPRTNEDLNENWISDRDRFSYEALNHADRLRRPIFRQKDYWNIVPWIEAIEYAASGINLIKKNYSPNDIAVLASPSSTNEEFYLLQKLARSLGTNNIDHRLRQLDYSNQNFAPQYPNLGVKFSELEIQDVIILVGCDIHKEQPLAGLKVRKMALRDNAKIICINPVDFQYNFPVFQKNIVSASSMLASFEKLASDHEFYEIINAKKAHIVFGQLIQTHPQFSRFIDVAHSLSQRTNCTYGYFSDGANSAGAWLTGFIPHRDSSGNKIEHAGKNAKDMLNLHSRCYILFNIEPEFDSIFGKIARDTIKKADFVVAFSAYQSESLLELADVILPITPFSENAGTLVNCDGEFQSFAAAVAPFVESRPAWKVIRVLANNLDLPGFDYIEIEDVSKELEAKIDKQELPSWQASDKSLAKTLPANSLIRLAPVPLYSVDNIVRRAKCLQETKDANVTPVARINRKMADKLKIVDSNQIKVTSNTGTIQLELHVDDLVADDTIVIVSANATTNILGVGYEPVEVCKC